MYPQLLSALLLLSSPALSTPTPGKGKGEDCDITVHPGQSIQSAINSAKPGSKIVVEEGTYYEQLTITTAGIHLRSKGAVLYPPQNGYTPNFCTGLSKSFEPPLGDNSDTDAGICIYGSGFELAPYERALQHRKINQTGHYIEDVKVSGFEIRNFTGEAIALIGGKDVSIKHNHMVDNHQYGFLTVGSYDTHAEHNVVTSSMLDSIALCMDDAAGAVFRKNHISNYYIALCTQTSGGLVVENTVENCCFGPFVDPGIVGAKVIGNSISKRNDGCLPEQAAGIAVLGAKETLVEGNFVEKFQFNMTGLGVLVSDDPATGAKAEGNVFRKNTLRQNDLDIYAEGKAAVNTFESNDCASSLPFGLCEN